MPESSQYLRIQLAGADYLLPGNAYAIEQRANLAAAQPGDFPVVAWRVLPSGRCPAYSLGREFKPQPPGDWTVAVFLETGPRPIGLTSAEVQLLTRVGIHVEPFTPPGQPPTRAGHLFNAAWVEDARPLLVFEPAALVAYLQTLGASP